MLNLIHKNFSFLVISFVLACAACNNDEESPKKEIPSVIAEVPAIKKPSKNKVKEEDCTILLIEEIDDCTLYTLNCSYGENYFINCSIEPIGTITNPPRPVVLVHYEMTVQDAKSWSD